MALADVVRREKGDFDLPEQKCTEVSMRKQTE